MTSTSVTRPIGLSTVYCLTPPREQHEMLVPIVRIFADDPDKDAKTVAREAAQRVGGVEASGIARNGRWALTHQPPLSRDARGRVVDSYHRRYGFLYGLHGTRHGLVGWRAFMEDVLVSLRDEHGFAFAPEMICLDTEGHPHPIDYSAGRDVVEWQIEQLASARALAERVGFVDAASDVWGDKIPASNYDDLPDLRGYFDTNGWPRPAVGMADPLDEERIASPVWYIRRDRPDRDTFEVLSEIMHMAGHAQAMDVELVPWIATRTYVGDRRQPTNTGPNAGPSGLTYLEDVSRPNDRIYEVIAAMGIERVILWGPPQGELHHETQRHLVEQYDAGRFGPGANDRIAESIESLVGQSLVGAVESVDG